MNIKVRAELINIARKRSQATVTYQVLCDNCKLGLDMKYQSDVDKISKILDDIGDYEFKAGRPALTSLIVRADTGLVGNGFYTLFERLEGKDWRKLQKDDEFWSKHFLECREFWQNEEKFSKHINVPVDL